MNVAMAMTVDGLLRALRWKVHDMVENAERDYDADRRIAARPGPTATPPVSDRRDRNDDRPRR